MLLIAILTIPVLAAAAAFTARRRAAMEVINLTAAIVTFALAVILAGQVLQWGTITAWDSLLYADALSALVMLLIGFVYVACAIYAIGYFRDDEKNQVFADDASGSVTVAKLRKYYALTPLFVFSMALVVLSNNMGIMWVAIEGTTLTTIFLVTFYGRATSLEAAWKYAIIGGVGLSMALFGTILTYYSAQRVLETESLAALNWSVLVTQAAQFDKSTMRLAFIFILLGYGTKAGLAPMHTWKPDVYSEAPVPVAAMLAAALLNCALYGLVRFIILASRCLGTEFPSQLTILFGLLSMGIAVPFILAQRSFRRLLAYSSIDHGGIMMLGLGFGGPLGALGMMLHMTFHSITKPLLFFCAGNVQQHLKTDQFRRMGGGLIHSMPVTGTSFMLAMLAVTGSPPFSIFQSEFTILRAAFDGGHLAPAIAFVVFLVAIFSGFLVHIARMVLGPDPGYEPAELCPYKKYSLVGLSAIVVVLGFWIPAPLFALIQKAAGLIVEVR
jgi:hydrogenase-4 component F